MKLQVAVMNIQLFRNYFHDNQLNFQPLHKQTSMHVYLKKANLNAVDAPKVL